VTALHVVAFAELRTMSWGVSWSTDPGTPARLALRRGSASAVLDGALSDNRFDADGVALTFTALAPAFHSRDAGGRLERQDQLCEVSGRIRIDGQDAEVESLGCRSSAETGIELSQLDSFRFLAAWLDPHSGLSLTALRPAKARGHEADIVAAAILDDPPAPPVLDPRLSTTYTDTGLPAKAGLELWLSEEEEAEPDGGAPPQYPRRAAGEVVGPGLDWGQDDVELHASMLRWHSHGGEGPGVYVLGRRR
jgi:hypothetical protein